MGRGVEVFCGNWYKLAEGSACVGNSWCILIILGSFLSLLTLYFSIIFAEVVGKIRVISISDLYCGIVHLLGCNPIQVQCCKGRQEETLIHRLPHFLVYSYTPKWHHHHFEITSKQPPLCYSQGKKSPIKGKSTGKVVIYF